MAKKKPANPNDVRQWAREQGMKVGTRGKLPPEVIAEFNKAHSNVRYVPATYKRTVTVKGMKSLANGKSVPVRKTATPSEIRMAAKEAGVDLGERGRIPHSVLSAYATGELTNAQSSSV